MPDLIGSQGRLALETRKRHSINNRCNNEPVGVGLLMQCSELKQRHMTANHNRHCPSMMFNCHGLTFASRRTWIWDSNEVRKILKDDDYVQIESIHDLLPGDIAIYVEADGDLSHSGVVMEVLDFGPRILSKWGGLSRSDTYAWRLSLRRE